MTRFSPPRLTPRRARRRASLHGGRARRDRRAHHRRRRHRALPGCRLRRRRHRHRRDPRARPGRRRVRCESRPARSRRSTAWPPESSQTTALLEGFDSAEAFAARVRAVASAQAPAIRPSAEATERLVADLTPLAARINGFGGDSNPGGAADIPPSASVSAATDAEVPPQEAPRATIAQVVAAATGGVGTVEPEPKPPASDKEATSAWELQNLRCKLLRIATRLGQSPRNTVVAQVIYRLELAEQLKSGKKTAGGRGQSSSFDRAVALAESAEAREGADSDLDFTCTILLLGKSGVGKSSTINSLLGEGSAAANAFDRETKSVRVVEHKMHGMTLRLIDTPGLQPSSADIQYNSKIMADAKRFTRKHKPDIVLYFDRMDQPARLDLADLPLLKTITATFGAAVWFNAIVVLTHGSSAPPDGQNGQPISYEMYFAQRSHLVQQIIRQAAGDMRLMNPVALAENHPMCRTNREGSASCPTGRCGSRSCCCCASRPRFSPRRTRC